MAVDIIARAMAAKANSGGGTQPDLSNYVQFDDYATNNKTGVINGNINGFQVSSSGNPYAKEYTAEEYDNVANQDFIGKGTLENIKDDYVESSTPVKNLNNSLKNLTPKQNAEGTDNVFDDGLKSPLYALGGDGKSEQKTTTGKNKFDTSSLINRTQTIGASTGNIYTLKPNTQYTVSTNMVTSISDDSTAIIGTPQSANAFIFVSSDTTIEIISSNTHGVGTINNISRTLMTDDTGNIFVGIRESASSSLSNLISKGGYVQIEEGSTATSYEPYTGGQPSPNPDYPQEINSIEGSVEFDCRGKNLLNNILTSGTRNGITYTVNEDKSIILNGTATTITWLILNNSITFSAGTYTMSQGNDNNNVRMFCNALNGYTQNGVRTATLTEEKTSDVSVNIPEGTTVSNLTIYPMIKESATLTEYEPYQSNQVTFNLGQEKLRSVGDVKDELVVDLDTGDYYKVENVGEVVFDGSENWILDTITSNTNIRQFHLFLNDKNVLYDAMSNNIFVMSDYFKGVVWDSSWLKNNTITPYTDGVNKGFRLYSEKFEDVNALKTWLSVNKTIVDYLLQNPTTKKLGTLSAEDLAKLKTFKGYNNVTVNTNLGLMNIRFTYGLDIKKYVDNKIAELSAQLIKGE